ncbi:MAG: hypothetical protein HWE26_21190 [Alteromonadaceae bacterium]|nr:hypothetical protein [Alteromonadaceae bacterium]
MGKYLITIYRGNDFDPKISVDKEMKADIDLLNLEMVNAGVRVFVGGLKPPECAVALRREKSNSLSRTEGTFLNASHFMDGLWILEAPDIKAAEEWGHNAAIACHASVEVRPFYG